MILRNVRVHKARIYIKFLIRKCLHFGAILNLNKVVDASCNDAGQAFVGGNCAKGDFRVECM